jgi:poly(3-hydroxybutyrate) depolymerase
MRRARTRAGVVYPNGPNQRGPLRTWNAGHCCACARDQQIDDVGFMATLLDPLAAQHPVDPARVYVNGMPKDRAVKRYRVQDNGHAWPGGEPSTRRGDRPSQAIDATAAM